MREQMRAMDANLLVVLRVLLEQRNLTRTADLVLMSRPAVSAALRKLREHFDDELLVRSGRGLELTEFAASLIGPVGEAVDAAEELLNGQRHFDPLTSTVQFSAGMSDYAMALVGGPLLRQFQRQAPHCSLHIDFLRAQRDELERQLLRRDVLIGPLGFGLPGEREAVFADELVCVVAAGNPALVDGALTAQSMRELPRAAVSIPWQLPDAFAIDSALDELGISERNVAVVVDRLLALPHVVAGSSMFAFMPSWLARRYGQALGLVIADNPIPRVPMIEAVHWNPKRHADPALAWLRQAISDACQEILPDLNEDQPAG